MSQEEKKATTGTAAKSAAKKRNDQKERDIASIMKKTGWSYQQTVEEVEALKKKIGITFFDYNKYNFHKVAEENRDSFYQEILEKKQENKKSLQN